MNIVTKINNQVMYVTLEGELDEHSSGYVRDKLDSVFHSSGFDNVILDMSNLEFMDSTGIGVLLGRYKTLKSRSKSIYITNANPTIEKIIKMSGIYEIMPKIS